LTFEFRVRRALRRFLVRALVPSPGVGAAIAAFAATLGKPGNADTLWHLAIGRWILAHRAVPDISRFYYPAPAGTSYDYSWLAQAILAGAYQVLGGTGIAILNSTAAALIFYFLYRLLERHSTNMMVNFAALCVAFLAITSHLSGRPVLFTVAFLTLEVFILSGFVQLRRGPIWLIPPIVALWANLHPGFVVAPLVILAFLPLGREARDRRTLALCLAATVVAVIVNPYGWRMYLMPLETARALPILRGLSEWAGVSGWEAVVWGGLVALVTCSLCLRRQPATLTLLVALAALSAGVSNRNMSLFGVFVVLAVGWSLLPVLLPVLERANWVRKFDVKFEGAGGWFWVVAIPVVIGGAARLGVPLMDLEFDFSRYPAAAVSYVAGHDRPGNIFVRETWSGYLLWAMPNRKLFYDAKGGFSREAATAHSEIVKPKANWRDVADRYDMSTFILERGSPLAVLLGEASGWRREYSDSLSEVFVRVPPVRAPTFGTVPGSTPDSTSEDR